MYTQPYVVGEIFIYNHNNIIMSYTGYIGIHANAQAHVKVYRYVMCIYDYDCS